MEHSETRESRQRRRSGGLRPQLLSGRLRHVDVRHPDGFHVAL